MAGKTRRRFGAIRKLPSGRWQARYRDLNGKLAPAPLTFETKTDAAKYLTTLEADQPGARRPIPASGQTPFGERSRALPSNRSLRFASPHQRRSPRSPVPFQHASKALVLVAAYGGLRWA